MSRGLVEIAVENNSVPVPPLSVQESLRLDQLEGIIVKNFRTFVEVGQALAEIQERKLYRVKAMTFKKYCKELFDIAESRTYELIGAAGVIENLRHGGVFGEDEDFMPVNERQIRPMTKLKPEQQVSVWKAAVESAPNGKVTANHVKKVVKEYLGEKIKTTVARKQRDSVVSCSAEFSEAFRVFSEQVVKEREADYRHTSRSFIINALDSLRANIAEDGNTIEDKVLPGRSSDYNKLLNAGYSLFRTDRTSMTIKVTSPGGGGWKKHSGPFATIKEMEAEFLAILQDDMCLEG